jgi:hypothetical protein
MMKTLNKTDVIFFGELHDDPIGHWLEAQVLKGFVRRKILSLRWGY